MKNKEDLKESLKIIITKRIIPFLDVFSVKILAIGIGSLFILMILRLKGYDITWLNYFSSMSLYFILYELKDWVKEILRVFK